MRLAAAALALAFAASCAAESRLTIATWNLEWMIEAASVKTGTSYRPVRIPPLKKGGRGDLRLPFNRFT